MRKILMTLLAFLACCGIIVGGQSVLAEEADVTITVTEEKVNSSPVAPDTGVHAKSSEGEASSSFAVLLVVAFALLSAGVIIFSKKYGGRVEKMVANRILWRDSSWSCCGSIISKN